MSIYERDHRSMRERMLAGDPYLADDPELSAAAARALALTEAYNATGDADRERRNELLGELLGEVGQDVTLRAPLQVDYGTHLSVGDRVFANFGLIALDCGRITIGADTQIGPNVQLLTPTHPIEPGPRRDKWEGARPITIGSNVWLGGGVVVCPGVTIGDDTVVGAGSVVTRDLPAGVVAVGNPARVVRSVEPEMPAFAAPGLPLRTARLELRAHIAGDEESLGYYGDADYTRHLPEGLYDLDAEQIAALVERRSHKVAPQRTGDALALVIVRDGEVVGDVMLALNDDRGIVELGWAIAPEHGGRGYATEAAAALRDLAFTHYGAHRVYANLAPENTASARVCARLGMVQESHTRRDFRTPYDTWADSAIWGILREEWQSPSASSPTPG